MDKEQRKKYMKEYSQRLEVKKKRKEYMKKPEVKEKRMKYLKEYMKKRYNTDPEFRKKFLGYMKKYQNSKKGRLKIRKYNIKYYQTEKFKKSNKERYIKKRKNPKFVVDERLRVYHINRLKKVGNLDARKLINRKAIIEHLKPFPKNLSIYEIDHKIPLSKFNLKNNNDIKKAFAPSNYQWLPIWEHQLKRSRTNKEFEKEKKEIMENIQNFNLNFSNFSI